MGLGFVVRGGTGGALPSSSSLHVRSDGGEGIGEVVVDPSECGARVADGEGNELHPSLVSFLSRNERGGGGGEGYFSVFFSILLS